MEPNMPASNDIIIASDSAMSNNFLTVVLPTTANGRSLLPTISYAKPFPNISKIEVF